jgi:hypothetical protein
MSLKSPRGRTTTLMTSKACDYAPVFHVTGRPAHTLSSTMCAHAAMGDMRTGCHAPRGAANLARASLRPASSQTRTLMHWMLSQMSETHVERV